MQTAVHFFSHQSRFAALQLLLGQALTEFSAQGEDIRASFLDGNTQFDCGVHIDESGAISGRCSCRERLCRHQGAAVIEFLARQQLAQKARSRRADTAIRLFRSDAAQVFDPFPVMARHRVLYLIAPTEVGYRLSVHKGYLNKDGSYQLKGALGLELLQNQPVPKYVSQSDRKLLYLINETLSATQQGECLSQIVVNVSEVKKAGTANHFDEHFFELLFASQRCFFGKIAASPLDLAIHYDEDFLDKAFMAAICPDVWIDGVSMTGIIDRRHHRAVNQQLLQRVDLDGDWQPKLTILRESVDLSWSQSAMSPIDVARFSMIHRGVEYDFEQLTYLGRGHKAFMAQLAKCQLLMTALPLVTHRYEPCVALPLGLGVRLIPDEVSEHVGLLRTLSLKGWQVELVAKQRFVKLAANSWFAQVNAPEREWFELSLGVEVDGKRVNLLPLLVNLIRQGKLDRHKSHEDVTVELSSGAVLTLPAARVSRILAVLDELLAKQPLNEQQQLVLARHQLGRLTLLDAAVQGETKHSLGEHSGEENRPLKWLGETWLREQALALAQSVDADGPAVALTPPKGLKAELRPYQLQGVNWLQFIKQHGFGGVLADDMGLGKTLQTLCSILIDKQAGRLADPVLVIAPTSLLSNWHREIKRFTPSLTSFVWSGRARHENLAALSDVDILITSYGILAQDQERLTQHRWYQVILDEAQTIKNSRSRVTKLVNQLNTKHRLCLSGTPMENHLGELWSLFHFLMPGFLGTATQFQRQFKQPIEKDNCDTARRRLAQRVAPFMLRRTKSQVATELPKKTVINTLIALSQDQADLYETIRLTVAEQLQLALLQTGAKANRLAISNALLKLRQVCCHPAMLKLADQSTGNQANDEMAPMDESLIQESSKLAWLENKIPNMIEDGRNILIFSSFTSMLELIAQQLTRQQIGYEMLTGKSRHRDKIIERFRQGEVNVFLISLKAGGAGLNLTEADVVIHVDPWWNPAAEEQASDRAYRIGQQKPVFVYKLICQNTVEERIQQLQQSKHALAKSMYQTDSLTAAEMDKDDWLALLQPITDQPIASQ